MFRRFQKRYSCTLNPSIKTLSVPEKWNHRLRGDFPQEHLLTKEFFPDLLYVLCINLKCGFKIAELCSFISVELRGIKPSFQNKICKQMIFSRNCLVLGNVQLTLTFFECCLWTRSDIYIKCSNEVEKW